MASKIKNTEHIKYLEPDPNAVNPSEIAIQLVRASFVGPPTLDQPQHLKSTSLDPRAAHGASYFQNAIPGELVCPGSQQMICEGNPSPNGLSLRPTGVNGKPRRALEDEMV